MAQNAIFSVYASKIQLPPKKVIAGDVAIYLKFALKVTHFFRKCRFRQISRNTAAVVHES